MDMIAPERRQEVYAYQCQQLEKEAQMCGIEIHCFETSIWDASLFQAWSKIVCSLLQDQDALRVELDSLCRKSMCDEIVLFEAATLLYITHAQKKTLKKDLTRHERMATIVKQFKLRCNK